MSAVKIYKRPWGGYQIIHTGLRFWVKKLFVIRNKRLSLQSHKLRAETWLVLSGKIRVQVGNKTSIGKPGDIFFIPKNTKHRIGGISNSIILETAVGVAKENDIIRFSDDYGRAGK